MRGMDLHRTRPRAIDDKFANHSNCIWSTSIFVIFTTSKTITCNANDTIPLLWTANYNITHTHLFCFGWFIVFFSFSKWGGWTTTCMVVTPPGILHNGLLHSPTVLLFSSIFPALINLTSFTVFGPFSFSLGHWERMLSFKVATLVAGENVLGPISDPSVNRNLISNWSGVADIFWRSHKKSRIQTHTQDLSLGILFNTNQSNLYFISTYFIKCSKTSKYHSNPTLVLFALKSIWVSFYLWNSCGSWIKQSWRRRRQ